MYIDLSAEAGVDEAVVPRLAALSGVRRVIALSSVVDVSNASVDGSARVPLRYLYDSRPDEPLFLDRHLGSPIGRAETGIAPESVFDALGMTGGTGVGIDSRSKPFILLEDEITYLPLQAVAEGTILVPTDHDRRNSSDVAIVIVETIGAEYTSQVASALPKLIEASDPTTYEIRTASDIRKLRDEINSHLSRSSKIAVAAAFGIAGVMLASVQVFQVLARRKDYGRRRALGATRSTVFALVLVESAISSAVASTISVTAVLTWFGLAGVPSPGVGFSIGTATLAVAVQLISGIAPAVLAAQRDPLTELRVP